ncbi:MAG: hypothetical protein KTR25_19910 [Myxococcales bacterium]|nr:hypothetical protein [Myxococcales bacterium]
MLHRLILLFLCVGGGYFALRWLKAKGIQLLQTGTRILDHSALRQLSQQAHQTESLQQALELRTRIWEVSHLRADRSTLRAHVDAAIRRLSEQEHIKNRILEAIQLAKKPNVPDVLATDQIKALEEQQMMLIRLEEQAKVLNRESERTLLKLSNIHLALLDVSASESVMDDNSLHEALQELESESSAVRTQAEAEAEVNQFVQAQLQRSLGNRG